MHQTPVLLYHFKLKSVPINTDILKKPSGLNGRLPSTSVETYTSVVKITCKSYRPWQNSYVYSVSKINNNGGRYGRSFDFAQRALCFAALLEFIYIMKCNFKFLFHNVPCGGDVVPLENFDTQFTDVFCRRSG